MLPVVAQVVESLRGDGHNPIHALDGWVLATIEELPPSSVHELAISARLRMGPRGRGPELEDSDALVRWVRDATERDLIRAAKSSDPARPRWLLTPRGHQRLRQTRGLKPRLGA
ncbi:MAG: hypothetical protein M3335_11245, partial [Actinomycetota bacterium]|nr:hypothetical protein [Actinomycetota bacterium]